MSGGKWKKKIRTTRFFLPPFRVFSEKRLGVSPVYVKLSFLSSALDICTRDSGGVAPLLEFVHVSPAPKRSNADVFLCPRFFSTLSRVLWMRYCPGKKPDKKPQIKDTDRHSFEFTRVVSKTFVFICVHLWLNNFCRSDKCWRFCPF